MPEQPIPEPTKKPSPSVPLALLYLRTASSNQSDREQAIVSQQHACQRRADELGAQVVGEYVDFGSGLAVERPGLTALFAKLQELRAESAPSVIYVIAYDHARITLDSQIYIRVCWEIEQAGAVLIVASTPLVEYEAVAGRSSELYSDFPARSFTRDFLPPPNAQTSHHEEGRHGFND